MLTVVTHTDHDRGHFFQGRVTHHGDFVLRFAGSIIIDDVRNGVAHSLVSCPFGFVTRYLGFRQHLEREIEHVLCRPNGFTVCRRVVIVNARFGEVKRDLVFVVVIAQVGTQTNETGQVTVSQFGINRTQLFGMHEHLQVLVLAHVVSCVLVHRACVMRAEIHHAHHHRLLVLCDELRLSRVGLTAHPRRQHVVHRRTGAVLLDVDSLHVNRRGRIDRCAERCQIAGVLSPVSAYQVERRKAQVCLMLATREVHTHETDGFPVSDRTDLLHTGTVAAERYLELVPRHVLCGTVTERHAAHFLLCDVLASDFHHVRTKDNLVLIVFLILVECIIEVDILYIRGEGRSRSVTLGLLFCGGRVALCTVALLRKMILLGVEVGTAVVVEIITGRVSTGRELVIAPRVPHVR